MKTTHVKKNGAVCSCVFVLSLLLSYCAPGRTPAGNLADGVQKNRDSITVELQRVLDDEFKQFYPLSIDTTYGGFFSDINYKWELDGPQTKMIVTQARHIWSISNAAMFYQKDNTLRTIAAHGVEFLKNKMWDREFGGFYNLVNREGEPINEGPELVKQAYGNAFAIYGLAAYYRASGDTVALALAQETFRWLEKHSYDPTYGGYFQFMSRDGTPFIEGYHGVAPKDQNSMIHILECFTELYKVWPDSLLKERLNSLLVLIRDTVTTRRGNLVLFLKRDFTPISFKDSSPAEREKNYEFDHVSFGHDVETAYLMLEASEVLGINNDTKTLKVAKNMVDHVLMNGWDKDHGGVYDGGYYFGNSEKATIVRNTKEWWAQVEAFNSFLMMSQLFPNDSMHYYDRFCEQWDYCKKYVVDQERGGWYWGGTDIVPRNIYAPKASIWKCNYHTSRGVINCINRLKSAAVGYDRKHYDPVNKNATPEAKKLLDYLYSIKGRNIIAGHHNAVGKPDVFPNRVKELTGKTPEIWGCDFINYYRPGNADSLVQEAYQKYKDGYIVTLMWHVGRPQDDPPFKWKESVQGKMTDEEWKELTTPGTPLNSRWLARVDTIAKFLNDLQVLGVPVLWRPYHESNGVWFWWGNKRGENGFPKLYRMMYDRFVNYHKLNNLIWVWNTNAPRQLINDEAYSYNDYFPGMDYVDVFATDVYQHDYRQSHHDDLMRLGRGKIISLGEVGEVPSPEILDHQPMWTWFMIWANFVNNHNTPEQIRDLYNYPNIITHENYGKN
jgi:cellobiose epimerase